ncbi:YihY/virulence factor BrkB family protein [Thiovibrio frasassiensis]|uniref:YihY/virulence factor BrkB family protein n=1 Tax=Thiovibrio frasassiensis TaxID=2984131 RepID=A0A9X4RKN3_9BACT|nr:YihY/virulence factor BrkB family protein [Thiovibrio frasassiensis]MDG4474710.1 YihY/virulence factor BrkB family protein [Thiovibrio frasassiensis]
MKKVLLASLKAWLDHRGASKGAALAFYALFSMTPILMLAIAVAGYFFGTKAAQGEIIAQLPVTVGPNGARAIQALLAAARDPVSGKFASLVAGVLLLVTATSVFAELKDSLDEIWGAPPTHHPIFLSLLRTRLLAFGLVLILAFMLLASLVCGAALSVLASTVGGMWNSSAPVFFFFTSLLSFGITASLFAVIYKMLPESPPSWRDVWVGAVVTSGLFSLGKYAVGLYLSKSGVASSFGAAGSLIALLLWVYFSAQIFFLGAEFTRQYALTFGSLKDEGVDVEKEPGE